MDLKEWFSFKRSFIYVAWVLWICFAANAATDLVGPFLFSEEVPVPMEDMGLVTIFLLGFALIEGAGTVLIRYLALARPAAKGAYNPYQRPIRFLGVHLVNWFLCASIVMYGSVGYFMNGQIWPVAVFGGLGVSLLCYHMPIVRRFVGTRHDQPRESAVSE